MKDKVVKQASQTIHKYGMIQGGQTVLVALSGGADSLCLLAVLTSLRGPLDIQLSALHVDHALRPESADEAAAVQGICADLGIACIVRRIRVHEHMEATGLSLQEAARTLRYQALEQVALETNAQRIAVGHTADDQAETVLMRLLRGTGATGLAGIPPVRGPIIRPIIEVWRHQTHDFCRRYGLSYIEDASNNSDKYLRNRVRHHLIPYIESEYNPKFRSALCRVAEVSRADEAFFDGEVARVYASELLAGQHGPGWARVRASGLGELPVAMARRVLRYAYGKATLRMAPPFERIEAALELARAGARGGSKIELGQHAYATRQGPWVEIHVPKG